ncbi:MAG TPA: CPBP family intramembrane glutamic endopeptidase [Byssovorax sp.]
MGSAKVTSGARARALAEALAFCALFGLLVAPLDVGVRVFSLVPPQWRFVASAYVIAQISVVFCVSIASRDADLAASLGLSREKLGRSIGLGVLAFLGVIGCAAGAAVALAASHLTDEVFVVGRATTLAALPADAFHVGSPDTRDVLAALAALPPWAVLPISLFVGFYEELCFRGFLLGRLRTALGDGAAAGLVAVTFSSLVFALCHVYKGAVGVAGTFVLALALGALAWRTRRITSSIVTHALVDAAAIFAAQLVARGILIG